MKTRFLSLLLLVSMLITAVPVMAAAAEEAPESTTPSGETVEYVDLHTLYVQDGLQNLFTTFGENPGYDLSAGTWTAKIGTGVATLGQKSRWKVGEYGGIGYGILYGVLDAQGKYVAQKHATEIYDSAMKLNFGISLLPESDFTVEYFAMYKPIYVADEKGDVAKRDNKRVETYTEAGNTPTGGTATPVDALGWFYSYTHNIDGYYNFGSTARGAVGWTFNYPSWAYWSTLVPGMTSGYQNTWRMPGVTHGSVAYHVNNEIVTYAISLDETLTVTGEGEEEVRTTTALFSLYRDGVKHTDNGGKNSTATVGDKGYVGGSDYFDIDTALPANHQKFWLAAGRPVDFFGARIYNRPLTAVEKMRNHAVDVMLYYGIKLDKETAEDETTMTLIYAAVSGVTIKADVVDFAAGKKIVEDKIAACTANATVISQYAANEHLTSFFTTFIDGTINIANGTWADLIGGGHATFTTPSRWSINANGSVGYNAWAGYMDADGVYQFGTTTNNDYTKASALGISMVDHAKNRLNALNLGIDRLPTEDFTVEYMAMYKPTYIADAKMSTADKVVFATGTDGALLERFNHYSANGFKLGNPSGSASSPDNDGETKRGIDAIGWFRNYTYAIDGISGWSNGDNRNRGTVHWCFDLAYWGWNNNAAFLVSGKIGGQGGLYVDKNPYQKNNVVRTFGIYVDETVKGGETEALFGIYYNANKYADNSANINSTANIAKYDTNGDGKLYTYPEQKGLAYYDKPFDTNTDFYLSSGKPTDFFAIRVYNKVLTEEEQLQNLRADFILYYDLDLSPIIDDETLVNLFYQRVGDISFESDAVKKSVRADELQVMINGLAVDFAHVDRYAQSEHLVGFFTTFLANKVNMENGTWENLAGPKNATLVNTKRWFVNANGSIGYNVWSGKIADDGTATGSGGNTSAFGFDKTNYVYNREGHLDLGIELLPDGDLTVELVAMTRPILMADAEESTAEKVVYAWDEVNGKYYEAYERLGNAHANIGDYGMISSNWLVCSGGVIDAIGRFGSFDITPDGEYWKGYSGRGNLSWMNTVTGWSQPGWSTDRAWLGSQDLMVKSGDAFMTLNTIRTYSYTIDETPIAGTENGVTVVFSLHRDAHLYKDSSSKTISTESTAATTKYNNSAFSTNDSRFYFGSSRPTDFFALRVYDVVLTDEEKKLNHAVDVFYYYGLEMPEEMWENEDFVAMFTENFASHAIANSVMDKAVWKVKLQKSLDKIVELTTGKAADYELLYVKDGLKALYFADESVSIVSGVWQNKVAGGANATLRDTSGKNYWQRKDYGVGYSMTYTAWNNGDYKYVGLTLPDSFASLDTFTVEAFAKVEGTTTESGDRYVVSGEKWRSWCSAYRLGLLTSLFFGNTKGQNSGLALRWSLSVTGYTGGSYNGTNGANSIFGDDHNWIMLGDYMTPTAGVMQITKSITKEAVDGVETITKHTYAVGYNNTAWKSYTLNHEKHEGYLHYFDGVDMNFDSKAAKPYGEYADAFSIFNGVPATIYAVRVYDRLLTADEKAQNRLVDLMYYHDVVVPAGLTHDSEAMKTIAANVSVKISEDAVEKAANKAKIETAIANATNTITITVNGEVKETIYAVGDTYTLPKTVDGKAAVAYTSSAAEGNFLPGTQMATAKTMTLSAVLVDTPVTNLGVSVKPMADVAQAGMRFTASFVRSDVETIFDLYTNVRIGILIAPAKYVDGAGGIFTREAIRAYKESMNGALDKCFVQIEARGYYAINDETLTISGTLYNFSNATKEKNPEFTAIAFIDIETENDTLTVYGAYNPAVRYDVKTAMQNAYNSGNLTDLQKTWVKGLIDQIIG